MSKKTRLFAVTDPREYDGNPFEVAGQAAGQIAGLVEIAQESIGPAKTMARNAELERQLQRGQNPSPIDWEESAEGRRWLAVEDSLAESQRILAALARLVSFDPRHPPKPE